MPQVYGTVHIHILQLNGNRMNAIIGIIIIPIILIAIAIFIDIVKKVIKWIR